MENKRELNIDWDPVDRESIGVYNLPGRTHPTVMLEVDGVMVSSPVKGEDIPREYTVEVEFNPDSLGLDEESFIGEYLASYDEAKVSQEPMTRAIRNDLRRALGVDDVFVRVRRAPPLSKQTHIGVPS